MPIKTKTKYRKINTKLDKEHARIFRAIDKLYLVCEQHWDTEDKMYMKGRTKMPKGHPKVTKEWKEHCQQHKKLLDQINTMKKHIINHIKNEDVPHFHWNQENPFER